MGFVFTYMKRLQYPTGRKVHAYVCILPQKCASEKILLQVINYSTFRRTDEGKVSPVFFYENCALLLEKEKHITYLMNGSKHFNWLMTSTVRSSYWTPKVSRETFQSLGGKIRIKRMGIRVISISSLKTFERIKLCALESHSLTWNDRIMWWA